jgi:hypothetical protein
VVIAFTVQALITIQANPVVLPKKKPSLQEQLKLSSRLVQL